LEVPTIPIREGVESELALSHALELWRAAAAQGSAEAHLRLGDYYYYGWNEATRTTPNLNKSAAFYWVASDMRSAEAAFNLGWMYQRGLGSLPKDLHLAKRYYDQAYSLSPDAFAPTRLALALLAVEYAWVTPWAVLAQDLFPNGPPIRLDTLTVLGAFFPD